MQPIISAGRRQLLYSLLLAPLLSLSSCYSYRLATHAQPATDEVKVARKHAYSLFWGILNHPQLITTPSCDALGVAGLAEVNIKTNFGNALLTVLTLGIYCPVTVEWKCAKAPQQTEEL